MLECMRVSRAGSRHFVLSLLSPGDNEEPQLQHPTYLSWKRNDTINRSHSNYLIIYHEQAKTLQLSDLGELVHSRHKQRSLQHGFARTTRLVPASLNHEVRIVP